MTATTDWTAQNSDAKLKAALTAFSQSFQETTERIAGDLQVLSRDADCLQTNVRNSLNRLSLLSHAQFIEHRVQEEAHSEPSARKRLGYTGVSSTVWDDRPVTDDEAVVLFKESVRLLGCEDDPFKDRPFPLLIGTSAFDEDGSIGLGGSGAFDEDGSIGLRGSGLFVKEDEESRDVTGEAEQGSVTANEVVLADTPSDAIAKDKQFDDAAGQQSSDSQRPQPDETNTSRADSAQSSEREADGGKGFCPSQNDSQESETVAPPGLANLKSQLESTLVSRARASHGQSVEDQPSQSSTPPSLAPDKSSTVASTRAASTPPVEVHTAPAKPPISNAEKTTERRAKLMDLFAQLDDDDEEDFGTRKSASGNLFGLATSAGKPESATTKPESTTTKPESTTMKPESTTPKPTKRAPEKAKLPSKPNSQHRMSAPISSSETAQVKTNVASDLKLSATKSLLFDDSDDSDDDSLFKFLKTDRPVAKGSVNNGVPQALTSKNQKAASPVSTGEVVTLPPRQPKPAEEEKSSSQADLDEPIRRPNVLASHKDEKVAPTMPAEEKAPTTKPVDEKTPTTKPVDEKTPTTKPSDVKAPTTNQTDLKLPINQKEESPGNIQTASVNTHNLRDSSPNTDDVTLPKSSKAPSTKGRLAFLSSDEDSDDGLLFGAPTRSLVSKKLPPKNTVESPMPPRPSLPTPSSQFQSKTTRGMLFDDSSSDDDGGDLFQLLKTSKTKTPAPVVALGSASTPVASLDSKSTPVASLDSKSTPLASLDSKSTPLASLDSKPTPLASLNSKPTPLASLDSKPTPVASPDTKSASADANSTQVGLNNDSILNRAAVGAGRRRKPTNRASP